MRSSRQMRTIRNANYPLVVKKSRIAGEGVFAIKAIPWGVKIIEFHGTLVSDAEAASRAANGATAIMELGDDLNIDGFDRGNGAAIINHSRRYANCNLLREGRKVWIIAGIEGVDAGEELTYDYGSDYYPRRQRRKIGRE
jgi:SET domain-containing protein